jgi:hypothetical protein
MSGILVQSAVSGKPLLTSNYGLMGALTRQWQLGLTVDSTKVGEITNGIEAFLSRPINTFYNAKMMEKFAERHSIENFSNCIFRGLLND